MLRAYYWGMPFSNPNNTPSNKQIQMKKLTALAWLFVAFGTTFFLACEKDNTDITNLVEDTIRTDTTRVTCNSQTVAIALQHLRPNQCGIWIG